MLSVYVVLLLVTLQLLLTFTDDCVTDHLLTCCE
jgi:hypothetical protein